MSLVTIWLVADGTPVVLEGVDARTAVQNSPDIYTDVDPNPSVTTPIETWTPHVEGIIASPVDAFIVPLPVGYDFRAEFRQFEITDNKSYLTFAFGDEGVDGSFYKDDETFSGYFITDIINATTADGSPTAQSAFSVGDGYGYIAQSMLNTTANNVGYTGAQTISCKIDPGDATHWANIISEIDQWRVSNTGGPADQYTTLGTRTERLSSLFWQDNGPMNALRICTTQVGAQIINGVYWFEKRLRPS